MRRARTSRSSKPTARRGMGLVQAVTSVGTVVALMTTILMPALIGLRDRNRQAVCTTRIGLLTRAMLQYAADYDETPPFMGIGWEDIHYDDEPSKDLASTAGAPGDMSTKSKWDWAVAETWVTQNPELLWNATLPEQDWAANGVGLQTGLLFPYARFETLYRCPEFERVPNKSQSAFNYTRTLLGRKWIISDMVGGGEPDYWGGSVFGAPGLIMRTSQIHRPSWLAILYDEWWWRHVGSPYEEHQPPRPTPITGGWSAVDCMNYLLIDEIGRYHGRMVRNPIGMLRSPIFDPLAVRRGNIACYDGHVELARTFWADISERENWQVISALNIIVQWLTQHTYAQRGKVIVHASP